MKKFTGILAAVLFLGILTGYPGLAAAKDLEPSGRVENGVRVVEVKASRYQFDPDPIVVNSGEKVRLVLTSTDVDHGLMIREFNVNISAGVGKPASFEFTADKKGEFLARCSVYCGPGHGRMQAKFIVQ